MKSLMDQYRCPMGSLGRQVAASMNRNHESLTLWGLTHVTIKPDDVVLDVGCGGGKTVSRLANLVPNGAIYGIDCSVDMAIYSRTLNRSQISKNNTEIIAASVEKLCFRKGFFNLVTAIETYYFWSSFTDAITEIRRVLSPGGELLLINEMIQDGTYEVAHARLIEQTHVRLIPLAEIKRELQSASFVDVQIFRKDSTSWNAVVARK